MSTKRSNIWKFASLHESISVESAIRTPIAWLSASAALIVTGLAAGWNFPIGAYYHDLYLYSDASWRIEQGQLPHSDFFSAVGPLSLYLFHIAEKWFPDGQLLLLAQWSTLLLVLPLGAFLAYSLRPQHYAVRLAIFVPFLAFWLLPFNLIEVHPSPGADAFGIYNRQAALFLYLLTAALLFSEGAIRVALVATALVAALLCKFSALAVGIAALGYANLTGHLSWRSAIHILIAAGAILIGVELSSRMVSGYATDIVSLLGANQGSLFTRMLTQASVKFYVILPLALLCLALCCVVLPASRLPLRWGSIRSDSHPAAPTWIDGLCLGGLVATSIVFESQNSGSQEYVYLWPPLVVILGQMRVLEHSARRVIVGLIITASLPSAVQLIHRSARTLVGGVTYHAIDAPELGRLGHVLVKPSQLERASAMYAHYGKYQPLYEELAREFDQAPDAILPAQPDFQAAYLLTVAEGVRAVLDYERRTGARLLSLYTLDYVDPIVSLLRRRSVSGVSIASDPNRTLPPSTLTTAAAGLLQVDAILVPLCPVTPDRIKIAAAFQSALEGRASVRISPCWDLLLKPDN